MHFDSKELDYFIDLLKKAKDESSIESYIYIKNVLNSVEFAIPFIIYPKGSKFVRCRVHNNETDFFNKVSELSYRKDIQNIKSFGRANEPGQSVFYCADDDALSLMETSEVARKQIDKPVEYITTGLWVSTEDIYAVNLLSNEDIRGKHASVDKYSIDFEKLVEEQNDENARMLRNMLEFLSKEFSRPSNGNSNHYKITTAFTNYIFDSVDKADGILYPSTIYTEKGFNFALKPEVVERKMRFLAANRRKMENVGQKNYVETEFIQSLITGDQNNIQWKTC